MVFSTIIFLFRFLPITLALYYLAPAKLKNTALFLCSLVFYCWGEVRFFPVMVALILINYLSGLAIEHFDAKPALRRFFLLVALIGSLGMLFYFKYANFVLRSANALLGTAFAEIQGIGTLPLGISFYTFQTLSYSIDVYRRDVKAERNIINFGAYVVMFPQLIAGPIVKYRDVSDQLHVYKHRYNLKQIEEGMTLFTFGLAKKVLLANAVGALWDTQLAAGQSGALTAAGGWIGLAAFGFRGEDVLTPVGALSGGEKSRLRLCMLMGGDINFLILDEPTNHLDIASREWMEDALSDYEQTLLFVSHDRYFIEKFATRVWALADGKITDFRGSYRDYCDWRERQAVFAQNDRQREREQEKALEKEKKSRPPRPKNNEKSIAKLEKEIAKLEAQSAELDRQAEEFSSDYHKLMDIQQQKDALDEELLALYERWEELNA